MTRAVDPLCTVVHGGTGTTSCGSWGTDVAQAGRHKSPSPPPLVSKQPPRKVQLCQEKRKQKVLLGWAEVLLQMFRLLQDFVREGERKGETVGERKFLSSFKRSRWSQWKGKRTRDSSGGSRISPDLIKVLSAPCSATAPLPKPQGAGAGALRAAGCWRVSARYCGQRRVPGAWDCSPPAPPVLCSRMGTRPGWSLHCHHPRRLSGHLGCPMT